MRLIVWIVDYNACSFTITIKLQKEDFKVIAIRYGYTGSGHLQNTA